MQAEVISVGPISKVLADIMIYNIRGYESDGVVSSTFYVKRRVVINQTEVTVRNVQTDGLHLSPMCSPE